MNKKTINKTQGVAPVGSSAVLGRPKPNWSDICKRSRAKKAAKGLCIWCGKNPEGEAAGLCESCREKCNSRNRGKERRKRGIPEILPKMKPWEYIHILPIHEKPIS
jgi:hypothetical protein